MSFLSVPAPQPIAFERAMVFIDASNIRMDALEAKATLTSLQAIAKEVTSPRMLQRVSAYSTSKQFADARAFGPNCFDGCLKNYGYEVPNDKGKPREKSVDAYLVADMVYHAAQRNCNFVVLFSADQDFTFALKRVLDFGCKTKVVAIGREVPELLREGADEHLSLPWDKLLERGWATNA